MSDCYPPRLGGIETQVRDLARHLTAAGHHVEVFTATTGPAGERGGVRVVEDDMVVHRMALPLPFGVPVNPLAPPEVRRRLAGGRFDVAHAHLGVVSPFATDLVSVALGCGLPVLATFHCVIDRSAPVFRAVGHLARWAARGVALNAVSRMAATRVGIAARGARVTVLGNGIDAAWWRAAPSAPEPGAAGDHAEVRVVTATRLASRKRPLATLAVLRQVRERLSAEVVLRATVLGEGPQRPALERYVAVHRMPWVDLPGRVDRQTLRAIHHRSDLYLSTARLEAFGIAALEAQTAGLPVVARRGTGVEDFVIDGVDGVLAATDAGLVSAAAGLAADPRLRDRMRAEITARPSRFDWPAVVRSTVEEYRRAGAPAG